MCGRLVLPTSEEIVEETGLKYEGEPVIRHINVAPTLNVPVITNSKPDTLQYFHWSAIPHFAKEFKADYSKKTFNAKVENFDSSPLWRTMKGKTHCVIISRGFYEWQYDDPEKKKGPHPHFIKAKEGNLTYMAGLWTAWKDPVTNVYRPSCALITLPANNIMAKLHNTLGRMPAFLTAETAKIWLDNELALEERKKALEPVPDEFIDYYPIKKVGDDEEFSKLAIC